MKEIVLFTWLFAAAICLYIYIKRKQNERKN